MYQCWEKWHKNPQNATVQQILLFVISCFISTARSPDSLVDVFYSICSDDGILLSQHYSSFLVSAPPSAGKSCGSSLLWCSFMHKTCLISVLKHIHRLLHLGLPESLHTSYISIEKFYWGNYRIWIILFITAKVKVSRTWSISAVLNHRRV